MVAVMGMLLMGLNWIEEKKNESLTRLLNGYSLEAD
jgi:hypothetical protein